MIVYRPYHNRDLPHLVDIWHAADLGRAAATCLTCDIFDDVVLAQTYFDKQGLIVACDGDTRVGFVHAGFGVAPGEKTLDRQRGQISVVLVLPAYRRRGIGRELIRRAEQYLIDRGVTSWQAGPGPGNDPFYVGIYGGAKQSGWMESDPGAALLMQATGYQPKHRYFVLQRDLEQKGDPVNLRLMNARRASRLDIPEVELPKSWWWQTRQGRLDSLDFALIARAGGEKLATLTIVGLDYYAAKWGRRSAGIVNLQVTSSVRRKGFGQACLIEVGRRLRPEMITLLEAHVPEGDDGALAVFKSSGFSHIDTGVVYVKS